MTLRATIRAAIQAVLTGPGDLAADRSELDFDPDIVLRDGTSDNQADLIFSDQRTLAASAAEDLDLAAGLENAFGQSLTFAEIVAIRVAAAAGNTNDVVVGGDGAAAFVGPFGAADNTIAVKPGGVFMAVAPKTGWPVTATTADLLQIANGSSGSSVTYDITIIGRSA